jgi:phosphatidylinositol-3-phosphatase
VKRLALLVCALGLVGCGSNQASPKEVVPSSAVEPPAHPAGGSHVFVIVMENKEYGDVIGSSSSPYVTALARRYASATGFFGVRHPSLPNYFALTAGTTFGVTSDCTDCQQSGPNIADQLEAAGVSWKAYMGGMPSACFKGATSGQYAKKHDPFMYYPGVADQPSRCAKVVPESQLSPDLRAGRLPTFAFLSPGLCDDTHDCGVNQGDRYLLRVVPPILSALGPRGYLVLTWDEGTSDRGCCGGLANGGQIATVIAGAGVRPGASLPGPYTHYSTLRLIEDSLGLPRLANAGNVQVQSLGAAFKAGVPRLP